MGLLSPKLGVKHMAYLCQMMAQCGRGSVQIDRSLELMTQGPAPAPLRRLLPPVLDHIKQGGTLADAFRLQRRYFPEDFIELVAAAEIGGKVELAFEHLARDYELRLEFLRAIMQQLAYPLCLWIAGGYIIPYFQGLMTTTRSAEAYTLNYSFQAIVSFLPLIIVYLTLRQLGLLEKLVYAVASRTWPWRGILHNIALVRFFRCMAMLLEAGLAVPQAIERSAATTVNPRVRAKLAKAVPLVQQGTDLTKALATTGMLPDLALEMVRTGEYSGRLEDLLKKAAQYIQESTWHYALMLRYTYIALLIPGFIVIFIMQGMAAQLVMICFAIRDMFLSGH